MSSATVRLAGVSLVLALGLPSLAARQDEDPIHEGKKASEWVSILQADPSARKRTLAVDAVGHLWTRHQYKAALTNLGRSLRIDTSAAVRARCAAVIGGLKPEAVAHIETDVVDTLKAEKDSRVRKELAVALGRLTDTGKRAVGPLTTVLTDPDPATRAAAADALAKIGGDAKAAAPELVRHLGDADKGVRQAAVFALGRISPENPSFVAAALVRRFDEEKEADLRRDVIVSLKLLGDKSAPVVAALAAALGSPDAETQAAAVNALGTFGTDARPAADALLKLATGTADKGLRVDAVRAFGSALGPALKARLKDLYPRLDPRNEPDYEVRLAVVEEIAAMGMAIKDDAEAMAALRARRSDPQVKVREAAAVAIRRIEKKPDPKAPDKKP